MKPKPYNRKKRFHFELSRLQVSLGITGALFIVTWVFILGVIVGRGYVSDSITRTFNDQIKKLQQEKKTLMEKYLVQEKKPDLSQEEIVNPKNLDFYNELSQKNSGGTQLKIPQPTVKPQETQTKPETLEKKPPKEPEPTREPIKTAGKEPAKEPVKEPVKETVKAPSLPPESKVSKETKEAAPKKSGGYMVLVGSYREEATAQSSVNRLQGKQYHAYLKAKDIPQKGGKWFRILMGPYPSRAEAEKMVKKLGHDGFQAIPIENEG
jgi:cell division septation protein DedD